MCELFSSRTFFESDFLIIRDPLKIPTIIRFNRLKELVKSLHNQNLVYTLFISRTNLVSIKIHR